MWIIKVVRACCSLSLQKLGSAYFFHVLAHLLDDQAGLPGSYLGYFDLPFPVLDLGLLLDSLVLLLHEGEGFRHVLDLQLQSLLLLIVQLGFLNLVIGAADVFLGALLLNHLHVHVLDSHLLVANGVSKLFLEGV